MLPGIWELSAGYPPDHEREGCAVRMGMNPFFGICHLARIAVPLGGGPGWPGPELETFFANPIVAAAATKTALGMLA